MSTLGERVKIARDKAGISQEVLAKALGITQPAVSQLEAGPAQKSKHTVEIAEVTGVNLEWLSKERGPMERVTDFMSELSKEPPETQEDALAVARMLAERRRKA